MKEYNDIRHSLKEAIDQFRKDVDDIHSKKVDLKTYSKEAEEKLQMKFIALSVKLTHFCIILWS